MPDHGQLFRNGIREGLRTIHPETFVVGPRPVPRNKERHRIPCDRAASPPDRQTPGMRPRKIPVSSRFDSMRQFLQG